MGRLLPICIFICAAFLSLWEVYTDSPTFDEPSHVIAGLSHLEETDYRLARDQPPLARMALALPLLFLPHTSPFTLSEAKNAWQTGDFYRLGKMMYCDLDSPRLIFPSRLVTVFFFLATLGIVFHVSGHLFGAKGALVSLVLAAFSPTMLAHGHLATLDMSAAFVLIATFAVFARFYSKPTATNVVWAALVFSANLLVKFSGPLIIPALLLMGATRLRSLLVASLTSLVFAYVLIWGAFGFRYSAFNSDSATTAPAMLAFWDDTARQGKTQDDAWKDVLTDWDGKPYSDFIHQTIRVVKNARLLPEGYIFGFAAFLKSAEVRSTYFLGKFSITGSFFYFPVAFLLKSTIPEILLLLGGTLLVLMNLRTPNPNRALLLGMSLFILVFWVNAIASNLNIGQRHLLSVYPLMFVFSGAVSSRFNGWIGRSVLALLLGWHVVSSLKVAPESLGYFNELAGGPVNGIELLADSNLDWGQDLFRLEKYSQAHPDEKLHIAYFGGIPPQCINDDWKDFFSYIYWGNVTPISGGTYVISANQMLGLYYAIARESYWMNPVHRNQYRSMMANGSPSLDSFRRARIISRLRRRIPDERIGASLFVYHLSDDEILKLSGPD